MGMEITITNLNLHLIGGNLLQLNLIWTGGGTGPPGTRGIFPFLYIYGAKHLRCSSLDIQL